MKVKDAAARYWETVPPDQMTDAQWEALCDRCGRCCLHSFMDEDSGDIGVTGVACRHLDLRTSQCTDYANRQSLVPDCLVVPRRGARDLRHLPDTCAYRRIDSGQDLPSWHPLLSGSYATVQSAGVGVSGRVISETLVPEDDLPEHVIVWVKG